MSAIISKKGVLSVILVALAALFTIFATRGNRTPVTISTTHAVRRDLKSWISSNGKVEPLEPQIVQSRLTTFIQNISVKEGQAIKAGQTLIMLDTGDLRTQLAHAREQLVASEDEIKVAAGGGDPDAVAELHNNIAKTDADIARLRQEGSALSRLYAKQAATGQEVEQNSSALAKAEADKRLFEQKLSEIKQRADVQGQRARLRVEEAQNSIRTLEDKLNSANVKAFRDGTVYSLPARPGMFIHEGDVLVELADLTQIRVRIFVDEPDLGSLKEGEPVEITWDGLPSHTWTGRVAQLPKTIVARGSRNVAEVLCSVADANSQLLPNTNVNARVRVAERLNSLTVPRNAVRTEGNKHYIYVVDKGKVHKQQIDIGLANSSDYEVLQGLTESDTIALPGSAELHDGTPVNLS